jgi:hypothetical protein
MSEKIVLKFQPQQPGDFFAGIPARDLTQADVDQLGPAQLRDALADGPRGKPMYAVVGRPAVPHLTRSGRAEPEMTRAEMNKVATNLGIEKPERFTNKAELRAAIDAVEPSPPVGTPEAPPAPELRGEPSEE